ncbi:hypothetical protein LXL04_019054 [Taraxacum kok-saghyz]
MAEQHRSSTKPPHVLLFPFPSQGHINPIIQFGKRLLSKGVKTTLVTTIYISNKIPSHSQATSIPIEPISDGFDAGGHQSADSSESYVNTFRQVGSKSLADLIRKLDTEGNPIDAIVYDSFLTWALDVAMEFGINGGCFFTQACAVKAFVNPTGSDCFASWITAASTLRHTVFCTESRITPRLGSWFIQSVLKYPSCPLGFLNYLLQTRTRGLKQVSDLRSTVIEWMKKMWPLKSIGPTLPSMYLDKRLQDDYDYGMSLLKPNNHNEHINWLNEKPKGSVVYVAFGSNGKLGPEQMKEVAWGLKESDVNFLWVVRETEKEKLPKDFAGKGLVVGWCRQVEVLAHEAVGCFVTHCGFNSSLESLSLGVPVVGMPQWTDQPTNGKCLEDVWGVGVRVKADEKGIVRRDNLGSCIKEIMEGERGVVARRNARKWRDLAMEAVDEGGSSDDNINEFVSQLKSDLCF